MLTYAIIGHPNAGKSTLFNTLTGANATVGNWHGVTVEKEFATANYNGLDFTLVDLPGFYSLSCADGEEIETKNFLLKKTYDAIILVVEAKKVMRIEKLLSELKTLDKKIVIFVNGYKEFVSDGGKINFSKMQNSLGVGVVLGSAFDKKCAYKILQILQTKKDPFKIKYEDYFYPPKRRKKFQDVFLSKGIALPIFVLAMLLTFWFCFGKFSPVSLLGGLISRLFDNFLVKILKIALKNFLSPFLLGLIFDGIFVGVSSVLEFLPQICALSLCMNFLNQSGFFSRFSAVSDDFLSRLGLSGRALYSLVSGFGCTAVALTFTNGISDKKIRKRVALSLPLVSCSAKTPVYTFLAKELFKDNCFLVISAIYFLSIILPLAHSFLLSKTLIKGETENYTSEIADMRIPAIKPLLKSLQKTAIQFIIKVGTVILLSSALIWILKSVSFDLVFLDEGQIESSILCWFGKVLSFILYPIGIFNWRYTVGVIVGLLAKEGVVSTLILLKTPLELLSFQSKFAFIIFCYAYTPCLSALGVYKKEFGFKFMLICAIYWLIGALLLSYFTYFVLNL